MMFLPKIFLDEDQIEKISVLEKEGNLNRKAVYSVYVPIFIPIIVGLIILLFLIVYNQLLASLMLVISLFITIYFHSKDRFEKLFIPYTFGHKISGTIDYAKYKFVTIRAPRELYIHYSYNDENGNNNKDFLTLTSPTFLKDHNIKTGDKIILYIDKKSKKTAPYYEDLFMQFCFDKTRISSIEGNKI